MFRSEDLKQLGELGIAAEEAERQVRLLAHPPPGIRLDRPCRVGDGIRRLSASEREEALRLHEAARRAGRIQKLVPASGAASRMFKSFLTVRNEVPESTRESLSRLASSGDRDAAEALTFLDGLERFAFYDDLEAALRRSGVDARRLARDGDWRPLADHLLTGSGLNYVELPKGLLKFHRYPDGNRTAFEEHLVEGAALARDDAGLCRAHFTVSPEHRGRFDALLAPLRSTYESRFAMQLLVSFSAQERRTDTLALDLENRPVRTSGGSLLLRPGGHGALIGNLDALGADIVQIQNIDNVVPDHLREQTLEWKRLLIGHLAAVEDATFRHLEALSAEREGLVVGATGEPGRDVLEPCLAFVEERLSVSVPESIRRGAPAELRAFLVARLERPLRVCGMVPNSGEPGGGPFWVRDRDGSTTLQIVESAQVDASSREQQTIFASSSHFNPVLLACAVRDRRGRPFRLVDFVDQDAVFISRKSKDGRELKALERPGLWNGAMAHWNTVFVEVPGICFTPVKTVNDLLRPEHQPPP